MEFSSVNTIWVLLGTALVFFMQAGFCMVETGFTRAKNAGNIIMKNLMDFSLGAPIYWLIGFGIMFGNVGNGGFFGAINGIASEANYGSAMLPDGVPFYAFLIFQTVFCATAATIVSGAMAERTKFSAYCLYSCIISLVIYPISGHWIWGGGWLAEMGFHDFAGSTAVHMVGGIAALIGAKILGPRIGKYDKDGKPKAILGHSLTLGALGVFILWFCWFGFNGASTVSMEGSGIESASKIFVTTNLSATMATVAVLIITWVKYKKPDVSMTLNGALAGLVAVTAGCDTVSPTSAAIIGIIAGFVLVFSVEFIDKVLKIDDPVGAVGVHGCCGAVGTILVGLFSDGTAEINGVPARGLLVGGDATLLGTQCIGVISVMAWVAVTMTIVFLAIKHTIGLRVSVEEEVLGLDSTEHGLESSYADFMLSNEEDAEEVETVPKKATPKAEAVPVKVVSVPKEAADAKITKISIICRKNKFEDLKDALHTIGVMGITVTNVLGCGVQKGNTNLYRGVPVDVMLLPKIKVEVVVSKVPVEEVVRVTKDVLYTGNIGDGKIFIYDVENVVKVRTGEQGYDALQGEQDDL